MQRRDQRGEGQKLQPGPCAGRRARNKQGNLSDFGVIYFHYITQSQRQDYLREQIQKFQEQLGIPVGEREYASEVCAQKSGNLQTYEEKLSQVAQTAAHANSQLQNFEKEIKGLKNNIYGSLNRVGLAKQLEQARESFQGAIVAIQQVRTLLRYPANIVDGRLVAPDQAPGALEALATNPLVDADFIVGVARGFNVNVSVAKLSIEGNKFAAALFTEAGPEPIRQIWSLVEQIITSHKAETQITFTQLCRLIDEERKACAAFSAKSNALAAQGQSYCLVPVLGDEFTKYSYQTREIPVTGTKGPHESLLASIARIWRRRVGQDAPPTRDEHLVRSKSSKITQKPEKRGKRSRSAASNYSVDADDVTIEDFGGPDEQHVQSRPKTAENAKKIEKKRPTRRLRPRDTEEGLQQPDKKRAYTSARARTLALIRARREDIAVNALNLGMVPGQDLELRSELDTVLGLSQNGGSGVLEPNLVLDQISRQLARAVQFRTQADELIGTLNSLFYPRTFSGAAATARFLGTSCRLLFAGYPGTRIIDVFSIAEAVRENSEDGQCAQELELADIVETELGVRVTRPLAFLRALALRVAEVREYGERGIEFAKL